MAVIMEVALSELPRAEHLREQTPHIISLQIPEFLTFSPEKIWHRAPTELPVGPIFPLTPAHIHPWVAELSRLGQMQERLSVP